MRSESILTENQAQNTTVELFANRDIRNPGRYGSKYSVYGVASVGSQFNFEVKVGTVTRLIGAVAVEAAALRGPLVPDDWLGDFEVMDPAAQVFLNVTETNVSATGDHHFKVFVDDFPPR